MVSKFSLKDHQFTNVISRHNFMYPILLTIKGIHFYSYGFFVALSFLATYLVVYFLAKKENLSTKNLFDKCFLVFLVAIFFARLTYFLIYFDQFFHWYEFFYLWQGGMVSYGGIFGGWLAIYWFFSKKFWQYLGIISLAFLLGLFFWRMGCFLAGDHPLVHSQSWYAINYHIQATLFESVLGLIGFITAYLIYQKKLVTINYWFWIVMIYYGLVRILVDFGRLDPMLGPLRWGQVIGILLVIIGLGGIIKMKVKIRK